VPLRAPSIPADPQILDRLREVLTAAGYSEQRLWPQGREGALRDAESAVTVAPAMGERLSTLARLFLAGTAARTEEAATALAPLDLPDLQPSGVIEVDGDRTWSPLRIEPFEGLFLASDRSPAGALPADFVGGVNPFATTLAWPTIRRRVRATLDLGTGGGIQALLAAPHSENVGVDVNPRALAFTAFNARLNGLSGVECQEGSWFEPIDRRRFDLIVANPPSSSLPIRSSSTETVAWRATSSVVGSCKRLPNTWRMAGLRRSSATGSCVRARTVPPPRWPGPRTAPVTPCCSTWAPTIACPTPRDGTGA